MSGLLFAVIAVNIGIFLGLSIWAAGFAMREESARLRSLSWALAVVSAAFVLGAVTRGILVAVRNGWISGRVGDFLVGDWHLVQSLAATAIGVAGIMLLRRVSTGLKAADQIASTVSEHFLAGGSLEQFGLTGRELEVLDAIGRGFVTDHEIAETFFISPATAGTHVKNIMRKTGVKSRRELLFLVESARS